ncbi:MAG: hypothetical protein EBT54_01620, partial [Betaproteobacteria bacterium]|nr:hypothetical protein [Betaproteobacteria bacterium]
MQQSDQQRAAGDATGRRGGRCDRTGDPAATRSQSGAGRPALRPPAPPAGRCDPAYSCHQRASA